jgi:D-amino-acid dehydrogenase
MHSTGVLHCALSQRGLDEYTAISRELQANGYEGEIECLSGAELRRLEPAISDAVLGGFHTKLARYVRPESLVAGLLRSLTAAGVHVCEHAEVRGLVLEGTNGWRIHTSRDDVQANRVVIAGGAWSAELLAKLGVHIPLQAAKGYSITARGRGTRPRCAIDLIEASLGCSPYVDGVRFAGTLELGGMDLSLNRRQLDAITLSTTAYLRDWRPVGRVVEWAGLRPFAPDGLPLIGKVPGLDRIYAATGLGMLGVTLAPATGVALAPLVLADRLLPQLEPFRLDRRF